MLSPDTRIKATDYKLNIRRMNASDQIILDLMPDPCFLFLADSQEIIINQKIIEILRFDSLSDVLENIKTGYQFIENLDASNLKKELISIGNDPVRKIQRYIFIRKDHTRFIGEISVRQLFSDNFFLKTQPIGYFGTIRDLIQNKNNSNQFASDDNGDIIIINDYSGKILKASKKILDVNFLADRSIRNHNLFQMIDPQYLEDYKERLKSLESGSDILQMELKLINDDGKTLFVEVTSRPYIYRGKKMVQTQISNISFHKEMEKRLLETVIQTEEKEKQRFAADLHDELGPFFSGIKLYIEEINNNLENFDRRKVLIDFLRKMVDEAITKTRIISNSLITNTVMDLGLEKALDSFVSQINHIHKNLIRLNISNLPDTLSKTLEINMYRILIELINNSLKHAKAQLISISIRKESSFLIANYEDNGKGFDFENEVNSHKGIGLSSIMNRVKSTHAIYNFWSSINEGMRAEFKFPLI